MSADRKTNLDCFHVEQSNASDGFYLTFHGTTANGVRHQVKLHFNGIWWMKHLANVLRAVVAKKRADVTEAEGALGVKE